MALSGLTYRLERCWGRHTCHMGVVKALAEIPADKKSPQVRETIEKGAERKAKDKGNN